MHKDEFNWATYPDHHNYLKNKLSKTNTQLLTRDNCKLVEGRIIMKEGELPMHPQHKILYEEILALNPADLHEVGCGWGDHLANINLFNKSIELWGSDISAEQIEVAGDRHPWLDAHMYQHDITIKPVPICELVFTQAVLIHLSDSNLEKAIDCISLSAKRHILLMENLERRNYPDIFRRISPPGWENAEIKQIDRSDAKIIIISRQ